MNILAAHLNTSRATEMYLTIVELLDIGGQNIVYHINLASLVLLRSRETFCIVQYGIVQYSTLEYSCSRGVILSLCREVFPREHLSIERVVQYTILLWRSSHLIPDITSQSERSLGTYTQTNIILTLSSPVSCHIIWAGRKIAIKTNYINIFFNF